MKNKIISVKEIIIWILISLMIVGGTTAFGYARGVEAGEAEVRTNTREHLLWSEERIAEFETEINAITGMVDKDTFSDEEIKNLKMKDGLFEEYPLYAYDYDALRTRIIEELYGENYEGEMDEELINRHVYNIKPEMEIHYLYGFGNKINVNTRHGNTIFYILTVEDNEIVEVDVYE